jgi:hypothetical protein
MNTRRLAAAPALVALAAGLIAAWGCNKKPIVPIVGGNQPPTVRITTAPLDTTELNYYVITLNWIGFDPDGRVDHFLFAVDPPRDPGGDTLWEPTTDNTLTRSFACPLPDRPDSTKSSDFHVFVIKAVDDDGAMSPPVARAFWSYTLAPRVEIRVPRASPLVKYYIPPAVLIQWEGFDDDGVFTQKPVKYKFKRLDATTEVTLAQADRTPDLVRQYYAPRNWAGWDSLPGDTTQKQYTNLTPVQAGSPLGGEFMFVVVAFDEAGAYSPLFSRNTNMVYCIVTFAGAQNPKIGLFNDFFLYEYEQGSFRPNDPSQVVQIEVPAGEGRNDKLTFNWYADPARDARDNLIGGPIRSYRWAVDITDLEDETRRSDEEIDLAHWSQKSVLVTSCRIGPYAGGETHKFYLEAEDINGLISLGTVQFTTVRASFAKPLLIVDDTRYTIDVIQPRTDCYHPSNRPRGNWPTAAELDTFLYAKGGVPWRCYPPVGAVLTTPGIFNGYPFDTLGTNTGVEDLSVRLSKLGQYQQVIWLVDGQGALNNESGNDVTAAKTSMRYMNNVRKSNTLGAYVRQGGRVWLVGNAATASLINFNQGTTLNPGPGNDDQPPIPATLTFRNTDNELVAGRFVYEQAHWRSEFKQYPITGGRIRRYLGRFESAPGIYAGLPAEIQIKSSATDPFPLNRSLTPAVFYQTQFQVEFLSAANEILEDLDPGPREDFRSTLDTLYKVTAPGSLQPDTGPGALQSVVMTRYHGGDNQEFLLTGFNIWNFRRSQCKALVDFVLQQLWQVYPAAPASASLGRPVPPGVRFPGRGRSAPALIPLPSVRETAAPVATGSRAGQRADSLAPSIPSVDAPEPRARTPKGESQ